MLCLHSRYITFKYENLKSFSIRSANPNIVRLFRGKVRIKHCFSEIDWELTCTGKLTIVMWIRDDGWLKKKKKRVPGACQSAPAHARAERTDARGSRFPIKKRGGGSHLPTHRRLRGGRPATPRSRNDLHHRKRCRRQP